MRPVALVIAMFLGVDFAGAQGLPPLPPGGYYINCPYALNDIAFNYSLIYYEGHYWDTPWRATSAAFPLAPRTWYVPVGASTLISTDGKAKWDQPQIEVLCWIYNALDIITYHYDPYRFSGTVSPCESSSGGGGAGGTPFSGSAMAPEYDPYSSFDSGGGTSCSGTSGNGDSGSGLVCHTEYIYIDISYDGGLTWEGWWEGYATVCE